LLERIGGGQQLLKRPLIEMGRSAHLAGLLSYLP